MRLTSLTEHRPSSPPQLSIDSPQAQFFLTINSYRLNCPEETLPDSLNDWPAEVCRAAVNALIQDIQALPPEDHFYEAAAAYAGGCLAMTSNGPWGIQLGPLHLSLMAGGKDQPHHTPTPVNPTKRYVEMHLEADEGDPSFSPNRDVARTQAKQFWEQQPSQPSAAVPLYQTLTDAQFAGMVRKLQQQLQPRGLGPVMAFVAAAAGLVMESLMAKLKSEESEITFPNVSKKDGTKTSVCLLLFRDCPQTEPRVARAPRP